MGKAFGNAYRTLGLDEKRGRWVVEQDLFFMQMFGSMFHGSWLQKYFWLGPGPTKTVIHVCCNGALVEHPVDVWKPSRILPKDYTCNVIFLHVNLLTSYLRFYVP